MYEASLTRCSQLANNICFFLPRFISLHLIFCILLIEWMYTKICNSWKIWKKYVVKKITWLCLKSLLAELGWSGVEIAARKDDLGEWCVNLHESDSVCST